MDFDFMAGIGWRDIVLVAAAATGVYLVLAVMRLFRIGGHRRRSVVEPSVDASAEAVAPAASPPLPPEQAMPEPDFARELERSSVELELERVRRESALLREELARLTEEVARLKAARNVSPLYNEATTLAQQGMPAAGIAGHCGISIGEAELVAALARGATEFERHEPQGEDHNERNPDSRNRPDR